MMEMTQFTCKLCGKIKELPKSEYDKKVRDWGVPKYCSKPCACAGRKAETAKRRANGNQ